jgi:ethanolamine transporter EutH
MPRIPNGTPGSDDSFQVGLGLGFNLGDMANIIMSVAAGQVNTGDDYVHASILGHMNLSDEVFAELALGMAEGDGVVYDALGVMGGIYYAPVTQLTLGLEAEFVSADNSVDDYDAVYGGFVAIWSF